MKLNLKAIVLRAVLIVACTSAVAVNAESGSADATSCNGPSIKIVVIDDVINVMPLVADRWRLFKTGAPASAVRNSLEPSSCVVVLDPDPVFTAIVGAAQPDAVLRLRVLDAKSEERSLGQKAGSAVGRYLGSYLGTGGDEVPILKSLEVVAEVLCAKTRRVVARFNVTATAAEGNVQGDNGTVVSEAGNLVAREFIVRVKARDWSCDSADPGENRTPVEQSKVPR
jgi:hypothetical protein